MCTLFSISFAFSCLAFASQTSFHLSLRPRRASTFFRKESRQRFARGAVPSNPHSSALRPISPFPALLAGLTALRAANRRQIRETLEKPRSKAQLFKRFCAKEDACALSLISTFFWLLAGLAALRAANRRQIKETPEKPRSRAPAFRAFLCVGDAPELFPARENRSSARARTRKEPRACAAQMQTQTRCATCSPQVGRTFSSYLSPFSVWLLPLNFLFICRSGRDGPLLSSEKKVDKDSQKGAVCQWHTN